MPRSIKTYEVRLTLPRSVRQEIETLEKLWLVDRTWYRQTARRMHRVERTKHLRVATAMQGIPAVAKKRLKSLGITFVADIEGKRLEDLTRGLTPPSAKKLTDEINNWGLKLAQ